MKQAERHWLRHIFGQHQAGEGQGGSSAQGLNRKEWGWECCIRLLRLLSAELPQNMLPGFTNLVNNRLPRGIGVATPRIETVVQTDDGWTEEIDFHPSVVRDDRVSGYAKENSEYE